MAWDEEEPGDEKRLVCGVCEEVLPGTHDGQRAAERAAEDHEAAEHPDRDRVVVVPVSTEILELEGVDEMVETAIGAQQRLDEGAAGLSG